MSAKRQNLTSPFFAALGAAAAGAAFDPNFHEALSQIPSPTVPAMTVIEQYRRGWKLAGRVLRPAQVIVSAGAPEPAPEPAATDGAPEA